MDLTNASTETLRALLALHMELDASGVGGALAIVDAVSAELARRAEA